MANEIIGADPDTGALTGKVETWLNNTFASWGPALRFAQFDRAGQAALTALGGAASKRLADAGDLSKDVYLIEPPTSTTLWRIQLPEGYDQSLPTPLVIWLHNNAGTATNGATDPRMAPLYTGLRDAGFIVASASVGPAWGNDTSRAEIVTLYEYVRSQFHVSAVAFVGVSMGGQFALNLLPRLEVPNVVGYLGIGAVASLQNLYESGYKSPIDAAFSVSTFAAIPDQYKPELRGGQEFRGVPIMLVHSPADATCSIDEAEALIEKVTPFAPGSQLVESTGVHIAVDQFNDAVTYGIPWLLSLAPVGDASTPAPDPVDPWEGLAHRWTGDSLGDVDTVISPWVDDVSEATLTRNESSERPVVKSESGVKFAHYDGVDDLLGNNVIDRPAVETEVMVFRFHTAPSTTRRYMSSVSSVTNNRVCGVSSSLATYVMSDGSGSHNFAPSTAPDDDWHIAIFTRDGTNQIINLDGVESSGSGAASTARSDGLYQATSPGGSTSASTPLDIAFHAVLHGDVDSSQRAAIISALQTEYAALFA